MEKSFGIFKIISMAIMMIVAFSLCSCSDSAIVVKKTDASANQAAQGRVFIEPGVRLVIDGKTVSNNNSVVNFRGKRYVSVAALNNVYGDEFAKEHDDGWHILNRQYPIGNGFDSGAVLYEKAYYIEIDKLAMYMEIREGPDSVDLRLLPEDKIHDEQDYSDYVKKDITEGRQEKEKAISEHGDTGSKKKIDTDSSSISVKSDSASKNKDILEKKQNIKNSESEKTQTKPLEKPEFEYKEGDIYIPPEFTEFVDY